MQTDTLPATDPHAIGRAATLLRAGCLVAFPTETVYGLGANALDADAVARIFAAKGRPATNPVIVHVADRIHAKKLVADWPDSATHLADRFWPGPLTLVLPKAPCVPDIVTAGGPTVALRIPAHPVALALLRSCGVPIAAPSANRSTELSPTTAEHVQRSLSDRIDLILDGGPTSGGLESTVLDVTTNPPTLLRPGLVTIAEIEAIVGSIQRAGSVGDDAPARSPGQMARHYSPRTPLTIATTSRRHIETLTADGARIGWLTHRDEGEVPGVSRVLLPADPVSYSARLYAALHHIDSLGLERIIVEAPPDDDAWLAVRDRLHRAAEA
ncbi:MAG: threonylcarbamoyl-AMP synthase [Gemmataceae bacterium]|nr:threonylcarbamoyl-AMP synthase [Gemmataceae bacterium]